MNERHKWVKECITSFSEIQYICYVEQANVIKWFLFLFHVKMEEKYIFDSVVASLVKFITFTKHMANMLYRWMTKLFLLARWHKYIHVNSKAQIVTSYHHSDFASNSNHSINAKFVYDIDNCLHIESDAIRKSKSIITHWEKWQRIHHWIWV